MQIPLQDPVYFLTEVHSKSVCSLQLTDINAYRDILVQTSEQAIFFLIIFFQKIVCQKCFSKIPSGNSEKAKIFSFSTHLTWVKE